MRGNWRNGAKEIQAKRLSDRKQVDDVALLIGQMVKMVCRRVPAIPAMGRNGAQWTAVIWLAISTEGDHRQVSVETYLRACAPLSHLTARVIQPLDGDDRLSHLLQREQAGLLPDRTHLLPQH
jgi:hypothetical protein